MELTDAAVLVPIVLEKGSEPHVLYTVRSDSVSTHKGEVCFPGGKLEKDDPNAIRAAVREAEEEIGIPPSRIEILHKLTGCSTFSGYRITPIVGIIQDRFELQMCQREVAEVFYMPISELNQISHMQHSSRDYFSFQTSAEIKEHGPQINYKNYTIWGATAVISMQLLKFLNKKNIFDHSDFLANVQSIL